MKYVFFRSLHRLTIDELKRQVDMLHDRERQAYDRIDDLEKIVKDYEYKTEILQDRLRKISDDVRNITYRYEHLFLFVEHLRI